MFVPKHWLFLFGLSCTFGVALLWLYTQNALLNAEVSSLERDVVALEVDGNSLAGDVRHLELAVADLQSSTNTAAGVPAGAAAARHGIASLAGEDTSVVVAELRAIVGELRAAQTPQVVVLDASSDDACTYDSDDEQAAQGNGDSDDSDDSDDSSGDGFEASIEANNEIGNYATNSGNIIDSFFLDGGQGDVGLNIVESVLNGVNISIVHQSGENSLSDSANTMAGPVTGNNPSNEHSPSFSDNDFSTPVSVSGTVDSSNAIGGNDAASATPASSSTDTLVPAPHAVTLNGLWTIAADEPTNAEPPPPADPPASPATGTSAAVDTASNNGSQPTSPSPDTASGHVDAAPTAAPTESNDTPPARAGEAADTSNNG